jgi:hypothetical protein
MQSMIVLHLHSSFSGVGILALMLEFGVLVKIKGVTTVFQKCINIKCCQFQSKSFSAVKHEQR